MLQAVPAQVSVYEVGLRDGLQNESRILSLANKKLLCEALVGSGLRRIELTSFVSPRWIPQLADAEELVQSCVAPGDVTFSALCPNSVGLERAQRAGIAEIAVFLSASETHNQKNTGRSIARSIEVFEEIVPLARDARMRVRGYVSTVWGCPYEGAVDLAQALSIGERLLKIGCYQVSLGDTIGVGTPKQTRDICQAFISALGADAVALHLHDTRGTALANALVGLDLGVRTFDASIGGLGGCPYAPGASGNLATEDLVYLLEGMGVSTGVHLPALIETALLAEKLVGRTLPGKVHRAGLPRLRGRDATE
jgi:hydroxymethylglutaryl-CoA lyase